MTCRSFRTSGIIFTGHLSDPHTTDRRDFRSAGAEYRKNSAVSTTTKTPAFRPGLSTAISSKDYLIKSIFFTSVNVFE